MRGPSWWCRCLLAGAVLVAGCGDTTMVPEGGGSGPDLTAVAPPDMTGMIVPDLTMPMPDTAMAPDLVIGPDMAPLPDDLTVLADMAQPTIDMTVPPCSQNGMSCGMPGMCADCTKAPAGHACVNMICGCTTSADCPIGNACDPKTSTCQTKCSTGMMNADGGILLLTCNLGCCDGNQCVPGNSNSACGATGAACNACGAGTPTCNAGTCNSTCAANGMGGAACGMGFCCNAMNTCAAIGNTACAAAGAACVDCTMSAQGMTCANGVCGCATARDCPVGNACNAGKCTTACSAQSPCNGGCCDSVKMTCSPGNAFDQCALGMAVCGTCVGNVKGGACLTMNGMQVCGCNSSNDCAPGNACNLMTHVCSNACDANTACNGGCCSIPMGMMTGTCQPGTAQASCGNNGGVCTNCQTLFNNKQGGSTCEPVVKGGACGCTVNAECPANSSGCNVMTKTCNFTCSVQQPCLAGCCNIPAMMMTGTCSAGTMTNTCGAMGTCTDCALSNAGHLCTANQKCGCNATADCPVGLACNVATNTCTNVCNGGQACNGGCCSIPMGMMNGTCNAGTGAMTCGNNGLTCSDCTLNNKGHVCLANQTCGCNVAADCTDNTSCNTMTHVCEAVCGDMNHTNCKTGCCQANLCVAGTSNQACGAGGGACSACANDKPTCTMGACTTDCGNVGNGTCAGGFCCSANKCVAGNVAGSCGYSGTCNNCGNVNTNTKCEVFNAKGPWFCGCDAQGDCVAAAMGNPGQACDTQAHNCTTSCGVQGVTTICNGGCCQFAFGSGTCRAGNQGGNCGNSGGLCTNCQVGCQPGAGCVNGACGCAGNGDCMANACNANSSCSVTKNQCCEGTGANCAMGAQCCSGTCTAGKCACIAAGQSCQGNGALCCGGNGGNGTCNMMNNCCLPRFSACTMNGQCCSGVCMNGQICQ